MNLAPSGARCVTRNGRFGNPFRVGKDAPDRAEAVALFRAWAEAPEQADFRDAVRRELRGKDLACACPLDGGPCHADVLLEIANEGGK